MCNDTKECALGRLIIREWEAMLSRDGIDTDATEEEMVGLLLAFHFQWDGVKIMEVAANALEDANYHNECEIILGLMRLAKHTRKKKKCLPLLPTAQTSCDSSQPE